MKDKIIFLILICLLISCENDRKSKTVSPRIKSFTKVSSPSNNEIIKKGENLFTLNVFDMLGNVKKYSAKFYY